MRELGMLGDEEPPQKKAEKLRTKMQTCQDEVKRLMQAGEKDEAKVHLRNFNEAKKELDELCLRHPECRDPSSVPPSKQPQAPQKNDEDDLELESYYHDESTFCAVSVIMREIEVQKGLAKKNTHQSDYHNDKADALEFEKETLESNVGSGILSVAQYTQGLQKFLKQTVQLHKEATQKLGAQNEHTKRLKERIDMIQAEIKDMIDGQQQQE